MKILDKAFSPSLQKLLRSTHGARVPGIDPGLIELVVAGAFLLGPTSVIWVVGENEDFSEKETRLRGWLQFLGDEDSAICVYKRPFEDPYVNTAVDLAALGHKLRLVENLTKETKAVVITSLSALSIRIEHPDDWSKFFIHLTVGDRVSRQDFIERAGDMGYRSKDFVDAFGEISWRGGIVDLFPVTADSPLRIEFTGDNVTSIRSFDSRSQKSLRTHHEISIPQTDFFLNLSPASEYLKGAGDDLFHLPEAMGEHRLWASDIRRLTSEHRTLRDHYDQLRRLAMEKDPDVQQVAQIFDYVLNPEAVIRIDETYDEISSEVELKTHRKFLYELSHTEMRDIETRVERDGMDGFVCSDNSRILENLSSRWGNFRMLGQNIPVSFENSVTRTIFFTFKSYKRQQRPIGDSEDLGQTERAANKIDIGDFVVHSKHGIGRFVGIKWLEFAGSSSEFLSIEYQNREFLYVPVYELDVLNKFVAFEGVTPPLDRLGGKSWSSKQARARKSIVRFARGLLELYAMRRSIKGNTHMRMGELEDQLQENFRFIETTDQKRAIRDVLGDLESDFPMDRLICGDVSFGKTEVAIRAALRVIANGRQVAMLCPTTILALQHFNTMKERFAPFPIRVALLSRMVAKRERDRVVEDVNQGRIDMVVGTHSLISPDLTFKNLGLYIIDEEQRFGVFQKEKMKQNREDVDVLSLSATPIPRTLSLSMAGLQDLSVIQSPPIGRQAVKNYVGYFSKEIILSALLPELEREGLIYIVYNNIEKIYSFKDELQSWLPTASFAVIHAKMKGEEIEKNLMQFIEKKFSILVSTTIIENGIDIPEVNTLIVIDADRFGLTQLYQLRGRIGRSNRQAFAFFLIRSPDITEKARSRLAAIREFADLGSGYKLAEFDLKLRGMGSLLGNRQHGHIEALGFDYYLELLNRTVKELKGEGETPWESKINIHFPYTIDTTYISDTSERLQYYKKILETRSSAELLELRRELTDRFGSAPEGLGRVFLVSMVRMAARRCRLAEVDLYENRMAVKLSVDNQSMSPACRRFLENFSDGGDACLLEWDRLDDFFDLCQEFEIDGAGAVFRI